jgi:hypothetical protein
MSEKVLRVGIKSDIREGKGLLQFLGDLGAAGNKTAKALASVNLGSAGNGALKGGLAKSLLEQKSLFKDLGLAGEKLTTIFRDQLGQATDQLGRRLDDTNRKLHKALADYEHFQKKLTDAKAKGNATKTDEGMVDLARDDLHKLMAEKSGIQKAQSALGPGGTQGSGLANSQLSKQLLGPFAGVMNMAPQALLGTALVQLKNEFANMIPSQIARYQNMAQMEIAPLDIRAAGAQGMGAYRVASLTGDLTKSYFEAKVNRDPKERDKMEKYAADMAAAERIKHGVGNALEESGNSLIRVGIGAAQHAINGTGTKEYIKYKTIRDNEDEAVALAQSSGRAAYYDKTRAANVEEDVAVSDLVGNAQRMTRVGRRLGGLKGALTTSLQARSMNISADEIEAMKLGLVGAGGRSAGGYLGSVGASLRSGMDLSMSAGLAGAGAVNGDLLGTLRGTGLNDPTVQEAIGHAVAQRLGPGSLLTGNIGLTNTLSSGVGYTENSALQRRAVAQNAMGMAAGNTLFGGGDAWQKSVNLSDSVSILGKGASIYSQNKLANLSFDTVMGLVNDPSGRSKMPRQLLDMGISYDDIKKKAENASSSTLDRFVDNGGTDKASSLVRSIKKGGGLASWARGFKGTDQAFEANAQTLSGILPELDPGVFKDEGAALGYIRAISGRKSRSGGAAGTKGGAAGSPDQLDSAVKMTQEATAAQNSAAANKLEKSVDKFSHAVDNMTDARKSQNAWTGMTPQIPLRNPQATTR